MVEMDEHFSTIRQTAMKLVLIIEADTEIGSLLVQTIKEETPYQAFLVMNAGQALQIAREITPDLLLLDYRLPGIDGFELYKLLHKIKGLERVPAILMSASTYYPLRDNKQHKTSDLQNSHELGRLLHIMRELLV